VDLIQTLSLPTCPRVAFVGAGGKTTAIFQLARQFQSAVLVTATTHLAVDQLQLADQHFFVNDPEDLAQLEEDLPPGVTLLTGDIDETDRASGLIAKTPERILVLADRHHVPLLIEADGSRRLPLKAPASHEPPIPAFMDTVIVVAGLSALGKPLNSNWVHRPEIFADLSGLTLNETISPEALIRVLLHPAGGLKNFPKNARSVVLLNQADTSVLQSVGGSLAGELLSGYDIVVTAALAQGEVFSFHQRVAGIILAAGGSRRFGQPKQLLPWKGKTLVEHVAQAAVTAGLSPVVVVGGESMTELRAALTGLPLTLVLNSEWQEGQSSSIRAGLEAVKTQSGAALFLLADQPQIPVSLIRKLIEVQTHCCAPIVAPMVDGQRGNPVLFSRATFDALLSLSGDVGGRVLFSRFPVTWVPWHDPAPLLDIDTPEDYQRFTSQ
jgi:molybdenum cofactor cytidylyltransferase